MSKTAASRPASRTRNGPQTQSWLLAALAEFKRAGMAAADTAAIVSAAGVAGTFFFHFPTRARPSGWRSAKGAHRRLNRFFKRPHSVRTPSADAARSGVKLERRLGSQFVQDFLALHFSTSRPPPRVDHHR